MDFGNRLAEERKRLGLKQAEFATLVGTDVAKQSLYETGKRELKAPYLARLAEQKVDIVYVLTGQRSEGAWLDHDAGAMLSAYLCLPREVQQALLALTETMRGEMRGSPAPTFHARQADYRGDDRAR